MVLVLLFGGCIPVPIVRTVAKKTESEDREEGNQCIWNTWAHCEAAGFVIWQAEGEAS